MKVSFLFWNVRGGMRPALHASLGRLAARGIDVFVFAEAPPDPDVLLRALNTTTPGAYYHVPGQAIRVRFFSRLQGMDWFDRSLRGTSDRLSIQELQSNTMRSVLLVGAHLNPANYLDKDDRAEWARVVARDIRLIEGDVGHTRTILIGDLNMNPFDSGLVQTSALHAVMSRDLAVSVQSLGSRKEHLPFYNPMWSCLGDRAAP